MIKAILLGAVQGITEFLPISSSGHLALIQYLFHMSEADSVLAFDVALHFGTLLAVVFFYRNDLLEMVFQSISWMKGRFSGSGRAAEESYPAFRLMMMVGVATVPAVIIGLLFKKRIEEIFASPKFLGFEFLATALILFFGDWMSRRSKQKAHPDVTVTQAGLIGVAQAVAILPAVSRSGSTIAAGFVCGLSQEAAARFSFLMAIPAILGSVVLEGRNITHLSGVMPQVVLGTVVSAVTGFLSIKWLLKLISRGQIVLFAYYCVAIAIVSWMVIR